MRSLAVAVIGVLVLGCTHAPDPVGEVHVTGEDKTFAPAVAVSYTYADVPWGSGSDTIKKAFAKVGLSFSKIDKDGDLNFLGEQLGYEAAGLALMAKGKVLKVAVNLATADSKAHDVYDQLLDSLTKLYGPPTIKYHSFRKPYHEGDGQEAAALRSGNAKIEAMWLREADGKQLGDDISLEITPTLTVQLTYESNDWESEANRRKALEKVGKSALSDTG
jgi:hypothetical protein